MILIVGLGNPGSKYQNSRHNLGFMVLDKLGQELLPAGKDNWQKDNQANALILPVNSEVILAKPQTFMNASGFAVKSLIAQLPIANYYNLWLVHDDVDLPLGKMKIRLAGASAGHHGVESIIKEMGTDQFLRVRLGIGRPIKKEKGKSKNSVESFVLDNFEEGEAGDTRKIIKKAVAAIKVTLAKGFQEAMNRFNQ